MLDPWNDKSVLPPPVHTSMCNQNIDLKMLKHTLKNIINILTKQSPLHNESAICSRLIYKFDKKFRNDIGYRSLKKVNCALRRYLMINLIKDIEQFRSVLPDEDDTPYYLPTKQMLQYILVRIIAFSKLMIRIVVCSKQAAIFYLDRVKRGESHWMSVMPYALLSRVWSMALVLLQYSCRWYALLYPFLEVLLLKGLHFLPTGYTLPVNLGDWLDIKEINNFGRLVWSQKKIINVDSLMINDNEENYDNILDYVNQINEDPIKNEESNQNAIKNKLTDLVVVERVDQGEAISRESFKKLMYKQQPFKEFVPSSTVKKDDKFHVIDSVTDKYTLQKFIDKEEILRNEGNSQSLTSHLSFMQWQSLKQSMLKLNTLISNNRKLQRRFQKIWQEKCLEA